ncbi:hypothetical protein GEMRC1_006227 [Eukaryota sp. GEM-RC1]
MEFNPNLPIDFDKLNGEILKVESLLRFLDPDLQSQCEPIHIKTLKQEPIATVSPSPQIETKVTPSKPKPTIEDFIFDSVEPIETKPRPVQPSIPLPKPRSTVLVVSNFATQEQVLFASEDEARYNEFKDNTTCELAAISKCSPSDIEVKFFSLDDSTIMEATFSNQDHADKAYCYFQRNLVKDGRPLNVSFKLDTPSEEAMAEDIVSSDSQEEEPMEDVSEPLDLADDDELNLDD